MVFDVNSGLEDLKKTPDSVIQDVDKKVTRDLERFVDGQIRARKKELSDDVTLWKSCVLIINEGSLRKMSKNVSQTN